MLYGRLNTFFVAVLATASLLLFTRDGRAVSIYWRNNSQDVNTVWYPRQIRWFYTAVANASTAAITGYGSTNWQIAATGDFNRDGQWDLVWRNPSTGQNAIWLMNGTTLLSASSIPSACCADWSIIGTGDFDGDGFVDILWRNQTYNYTYVWYFHAVNYLGNAAIALYPAASWRATALGDFNNDTYPDILWQNDAAQSLGFWCMNNTNLIATAFINGYPSTNNWTAVGTGPFSVINNSDLLWNHSIIGENYAWLLTWTNVSQICQLPTLSSNQFGGTGPAGSLQALEVSATAVSSPASLTLSWRLGTGSPVSVKRRLYPSSSWGTPLQTSYYPNRLTNSDLVVGQRYEYSIANTGSSASEYFFTGIAATPVEFRGRVMLVVANDITNSLFSDLEMFRTNLVGDGWTVARINVPPHDDNTWSNNISRITSIKSAITNYYYSVLGTSNLLQSVILIGHVPIPHTAFMNPDGHGLRALPCDGYYGDVDGSFTDLNDFTNCLLNTCPCEPRHDNFRGDGKWDQFTWPPNSEGSSALELAVGRIDMANLPSFTNQSPIDLLRQYMNKDVRYRAKAFTFPQRLFTGFYFDTDRDQFPDAIGWGMRIGSRLFGFSPDKIINGDGLRPGNGATWVVDGGYGASYHVQQYGYGYHAVTATNNPLMGDVSIIPGTNQPESGFYSLTGSCFMDFGYGNNLMRGLVAVGTNANLGAMWFTQGYASDGGAIPLHFERIALGETVGTELVRCLNETSSYTTHITWIGDPTLRAQAILPPSGLTGTATLTNVSLLWTASGDASQYFVYRSQNNLDGPFTRIAAVSSTSYGDSSAQAGNNTYMVRAAALTATSSGSYTNLSQGIFTTVFK